MSGMSYRQLAEKVSECVGKKIHHNSINHLLEQLDRESGAGMRASGALTMGLLMALPALRARDIFGPGFPDIRFKELSADEKLEGTRPKGSWIPKRA
jgi:hypothetical protein